MVLCKESPLIQLRTVSKSFRETTALDSVSFDINRGEIFGLLGPNGAGKTTSIRVLLGLTKPSSGQVYLKGAPIDELGVDGRRQIGWVAQQSTADPLLTGREYLTLIAELYQVHDVKSHVQRTLDEYGLSEAADRVIRGYSGGMLKRLEIAASIIHDPDILVLDEPTAALDVTTRHQLWDLIRGLKRSGRTVILTTHYLDEADVLCDRIMILNNGTISAGGTSDELKRAVGTRDLVLGWDDEVVAAQARQVLSGELNNSALRAVSGVIEVPITAQSNPTVEIVDALRAANVPQPDLLNLRPVSLDQVFARVTGRVIDPATGSEIVRSDSERSTEPETRLPVPPLAEIVDTSAGQPSLGSPRPGTFLAELPRFASQNFTLLKRWLWRMKRDRYSLGVAVLQPILWFVLFGHMFEETLNTAWAEGGYLRFITAGAVMMSVFNFALVTGLEVMLDRERGTLDRLALSPMHRLSIVTSRLVFVMAVGVLQAIGVIIVATLFGVSFEEGFSAIPALIGAAALLAAGVSALSVGLGLVLTNHGQFYSITGLAALPVVLVSTVFVPVESMPDWLAWVARVNPMTYAVNGARAVIVGGPDADSLWISFGALAAFAAVMTWGAMIAGRRGMAE